MRDERLVLPNPHSPYLIDIPSITTMRIVQLFFLILLLVSCRTETDELLGHWHSVPLEDRYFWTLDITDSTTQVNKFYIERWSSFPKV